MTIEAFAPAKINLTLHITGQRADGYHELDSVVMLADVGDRLEVENATDSSLSVVGPMRTGVPSDHRNLVMQAANRLGLPGKMTLHKHLPAMAGIGGGSSDAAAAVRALCQLHSQPLPEVSDLLSLGADVPVCMEPNLVRMQGIGEQVDRLGHCESWPMILVNPKVSVSTPDVFQSLSCRQNPKMQIPQLDWGNWEESVAWLAAQRNDMQDAAIRLHPVIGRVLDALTEKAGCKLARMSGSGATCFAIFFDPKMRDQALQMLRQDFPNWWSVATQSVGKKWR